MQITYHLTEDDYLKFNLFHVKQSESVMKSLKLQRYLTPFFYVFIAYLFSLISDISFLFTLIPFLIIGVLWAIFYPKYFFGHIIRQTKKMVREGQNEGLLGDHTMTLTDEGIVDVTSNGETRVQWSGITDLKEDEEMFYLYNSSVSAYILPKRNLEEPENLRSYIASKMI